MTEKELLTLKEKISVAEKQVLKLTGEQESLLKQLKKEWECETLKEAEKRMEKLKKEKAKLQEKIEKELEELEKLLPNE